MLFYIASGNCKLIFIGFWIWRFWFRIFGLNFLNIAKCTTLSSLQNDTAAQSLRSKGSIQAQTDRLTEGEARLHVGIKLQTRSRAISVTYRLPKKLKQIHKSGMHFLTVCTPLHSFRIFVTMSLAVNRLKGKCLNISIAYNSSNKEEPPGSAWHKRISMFGWLTPNAMLGCLTQTCFGSKITNNINGWSPFLKQSH